MAEVMAGPPLELALDVAFEEPSRAPKLTSRQVLDAIRQRHPAVRWAFIEEVRADTGFGHEQRLDAWAAGFWRQDGIVAYEVKVSRADFLREVKDPGKRAFGMAVSTEFYFAAPVRLIRPHEIPAGCGLVEVYEDGRQRTRVKAPERMAVLGAPWGFVASALRYQRREGFRSGPGHRGQCLGFGRYELQTVTYGESGELTFTHKNFVTFDNSDEEWCTLEMGHTGGCRTRRRDA